jgi:hypothetical protein
MLVPLRNVSLLFTAAQQDCLHSSQACAVFAAL